MNIWIAFLKIKWKCTQFKMDWFPIKNPEKKKGLKCSSESTPSNPWSEHPRRKLLITCCIWLLFPQVISLKLPHSLVNYFFSLFASLIPSFVFPTSCDQSSLVSLLFVHLLHSLCVFISIIYFQLMLLLLHQYTFSCLLCFH